MSDDKEKKIESKAEEAEKAEASSTSEKAESVSKDSERPSKRRLAAPPKSKPTEKPGIAAHNSDNKRSGEYTLREGHGWANAWKAAAGVGLLSLLASAAGYTMDPRRFAFSYLFAFMAVLTTALGMLFFVFLQHLTSSGWSVTVRRTAEIFSSALAIFALLFLPVYFLRGRLFPWIGGEAASAVRAEASTTKTTGALVQGNPGNETRAAHAEHEQNGQAATGDAVLAGRLAAAHGAKATDREPTLNANERGEKGDPNELDEERTLNSKRGYLNDTFFSIRAVIYFIIWGWLGWALFAKSVKQDTTRDPKLTVSMKRLSAGAAYLFGFSLTFASFDWLMSLTPTWFSTIFGVYVFAGSAVAGYALLILATMGLRSSGILVKEINVEHYHDLGKMMFGFMIFWAYIAFSQFMLIWYAAIPEETVWFHMRWDHGPWATVSLALIILNFIVPFFLIISRNTKRKLGVLTFGAAWLLIMHFVDVYWLVMPSFGQDGFTFSWIDLTCLLGVGGIYLAAVFFRMSKTTLIPIGDPRLQRALKFENA